MRKWKYERYDGTEGECWALGSKSYLKESIRVCDNQMNKYNLSFTSAKKEDKLTPFNSIDYRPELDQSHFCTDELTNLYQNLIGVLRWSCELRRVDILHEISRLSQYLAQPRKGHLEQVLNIFYYLKKHHTSWMALDPTSFDVDWFPKNYEASPK